MVGRYHTKRIVTILPKFFKFETGNGKIDEVR